MRLMLNDLDLLLKEGEPWPVAHLDGVSSPTLKRQGFYPYDLLCTISTL